MQFFMWGDATNINQSTYRTSTNWTSFGIRSNEIVNFIYGSSAVSRVRRDETIDGD